MRAYLPPMKPIPEGATKEDRARMHEDYKKEFRRLNPGHYNKDGNVKKWWQIF
jgi:hypothetical protein